MAKKDYYQILEIDRNADEASIKWAYRNLAMRYHPDRNSNPDAAQSMKEINEAYAVLGDPERREHYDLYGHAGFEGLATEGIFRGVDFNSLFREFGLGAMFGGSMFGTLFGSRRRATTRAPHRGRGVKYAGLVECEQCLGSGQIVHERRTSFSLLRQITPCPVCAGRGRVVIDPCDHCQGRGVVQKPERLTITIPAGVTTGDAIKVPGLGNAGESGASPGDLYVVLCVE